MIFGTGKKKSDMRLSISSLGVKSFAICAPVKLENKLLILGDSSGTGSLVIVDIPLPKGSGCAAKDGIQKLWNPYTLEI